MTKRSIWKGFGGVEIESETLNGEKRRERILIEANELASQLGILKSPSDPRDPRSKASLIKGLVKSPVNTR